MVSGRTVASNSNSKCHRFCNLKPQTQSLTRQTVYIQRNIDGISRNVYTSSPTLTAWHNFTRRDLSYSHLISPATVQRTHSGLHVRFPIFLPYFNQTWIFFRADFHKSSHYQISQKICPARSADRRTDRYYEAYGWKFMPRTNEYQVT